MRRFAAAEQVFGDALTCSAQVPGPTWAPLAWARRTGSTAPEADVVLLPLKDGVGSAPGAAGADGAAGAGAIPLGAGIPPGPIGSGVGEAARDALSIASITVVGTPCRRRARIFSVLSS
jgi:hypothetical protein